MISYSELCTALAYDDRENEHMFMPNEIFTDFPTKIEGGSSHVAFAYSYYYLISYLYRFVKYVTYSAMQGTYTKPGLKRILRYSQNNKTMDSIIKQGGELDKLGYTRTTTDYPVAWNVEEYTNANGDTRFHHWYTLRSQFLAENPQLKDEFSTVQRIKLPIKMLYRTSEAEEDDYANGTFFDTDNTTMIPVEVFIKCMSNKPLGVVAFWLYSFIKYKSSYYGGSYDVPLKRLPSETGIKRQRLKEMLKELESFNMITNDHKPFVLGIPEGKSVEACSFAANEWTDFLDTKETVRVREVLSAKTFVDRGGTFLDVYETE